MGLQRQRLGFRGVGHLQRQRFRGQQHGALALRRRLVDQPGRGLALDALDRAVQSPVAPWWSILACAAHAAPGATRTASSTIRAGGHRVARRVASTCRPRRPRAWCPAAPAWRGRRSRPPPGRRRAGRSGRSGAASAARRARSGRRPPRVSPPPGGRRRRSPRCARDRLVGALAAPFAQGPARPRRADSSHFISSNRKKASAATASSSTTTTRMLAVRISWPSQMTDTSRAGRRSRRRRSRSGREGRGTGRSAPWD